MKKKGAKKTTGNNFQVAPEVQHLNLTPPQEQRQFSDLLAGKGQRGPSLQHLHPPASLHPLLAAGGI